MSRRKRPVEQKIGMKQPKFCPECWSYFDAEQVEAEVGTFFGWWCVPAENTHYYTTAKTLTPEERDFYGAYDSVDDIPGHRG